ncbi:MAG: hypothetical protein KBF22_11940, partial [Ottowia sp.]|nr:hypothetical protein [Ottowia sp.]
MSSENARTSQKAQNKMVKTLRDFSFHKRWWLSSLLDDQEASDDAATASPVWSGLARDQALVATRRLIAGKPAPTPGSETSSFPDGRQMILLRLLRLLRCLGDFRVQGFFKLLSCESCISPAAAAATA